MNFKQGARVYACDGALIGSLARVVLDPESMHVISMVMHKGPLLSEDKVIPVQWVDSAKDESIILVEEAGDPALFPPFEHKHYEIVDEGDLPRSGQVLSPPSVPDLYPTLGGAPLSAPTPARSGPAYEARTEENIPPDSVPLRPGARVLDKKGDRVGSVEQVLTDPQIERATHLVVTQGGLLRKERKLVPIAWVDEVERETVHLAVGERQVERLLPYER